MGATYRDTMVRTTFPVFKIFCYISFMISNDFSINHIRPVLWHSQDVLLFSHVIILSQITLRRNVFNLHGLEIDKYTLFQVATIECNRHFRCRTAQPRMEFYAFFIHYKRLVIRR